MYSVLMHLPPPPDLLRRFVDTPFHTKLRLGHACVSLAANQQSVISRLSAFVPAGAHESQQAGIQWRVVVDDDAGPPDWSTPIMTNSGSVVTAWFGNGNLLSFDWDCGEAYAFVASEHEQAVAEIMAPLLSSWMNRDANPREGLDR